MQVPKPGSATWRTPREIDVAKPLQTVSPLSHPAVHTVSANSYPIYLKMLQCSDMMV
jgi:hypothetical protein